MNEHIDAALREWEYQPGNVQARLVHGADGRPVIQLRVDLGVLQIETTGRPDGTRPHGSQTYYDYLRRQAFTNAKAGDPFVLNPEQCQEADREFVQYYHRRICWLALRQYRRAIADADHTLAFMDFVRDHSPGEDYTQAHEQYRGYVSFQRTQACAALALEEDDPERAVDEVRAGLQRLHDYLAAQGAAEHVEEDGMVQHLRKVERTLRDRHGISATLQEQLDEAVANEEYETAAKLRDAIRRKHC